jgi:hypothetical protein
MRVAAIICVALLCALSAHAADGSAPRPPTPVVVPGLPSDHLDRAVPTPDDASLIKYQATLHDLFKEAFSQNVQVRMLAEPSFAPKYVVALVTTGSGLRVLYVRALRSVGHGEQSPLAVSRCESDIDAALAERVISIWKRMIVAASPKGEVRSGLDGDGYYFSIREGQHERMAQTWSPDEGTTPAVLVELASTMATYCRSRQWSLLVPLSWYYSALMERQVAALNARLNADVHAR